VVSLSCVHFFDRFSHLLILFSLQTALFIFFALQFPKNGTIGIDTVQSWWGNTVWYENADGNGVAYRTLAEGETFGPKTW